MPNQNSFPSLLRRGELGCLEGAFSVSSTYNSYRALSFPLGLYECVFADNFENILPCFIWQTLAGAVERWILRFRLRGYLPISLVQKSFAI